MKKIRRKIYDISKKTGDKFGFDLPYFVENGFWMLLNQGVILLGGLATSILFARYFSKDVYGQYQFVLSIIAFFSFFSVPGLNPALIRSIANDNQGDYKPAVKFSFKYSLIGSIFVLITAFYYYFYLQKTTIALALMSASVFFPLLFSFDKWQAFLKGQEKFAFLTRNLIIQTAGKTILILSAILLFPDNLLVVVIAYLFGTAFFHILWYVKSSKLPKNNKKGKDTFSYAGFITKLGILNTLVNNFDKLLIGILDIKALAVYSIALGLINIIKSFIKSISAITFPKFAKYNITVSFKQKMLIFFTGIVIATIFYFIADNLILLLYTDKYLPSAHYFKLFVFITPLFMISSVLSKKVLANKNKSKLIHLKITIPIITLLSSVTVYIVSKNIDYFIFTKFFVFNILNFLLLSFSVKKKHTV
ncbi:MAG: oligosaccharide flippase family protein [Chlorobi bacterium]|nr:oligosaccharide flippase family protein [Chlorobiota bacterium]